MNLSIFNNIMKPARRKQYTAYVCKVPVGSAVLSKGVDDILINKLNGVCYLSPAEVGVYRRAHPVWEQFSHKVTTKYDFIIMIGGVMRRIQFAELSADYSYPDKTPITPDSLRQKFFVSEKQLDRIVPVNITLARAIKKKRGSASELEENAVMRWTKIIYTGKHEEFAVAVKDDVYRALQGCLPNRQGHYYLVREGTVYRLVEENVFLSCFDCRSWGSVKEREDTFPDELFSLSDPTNFSSSFSDMICDYINSILPYSIGVKLNILQELSIKPLTDYCISFKYLSGGFGDLHYMLIYAYRGEYFLSLADKDKISLENPQAFKECLQDLMSNQWYLLRSKELKEFKELLVAFLSLTNVGVLSSYYVPRMLSSEYEALKAYSGSDFRDINEFLRGNEEVGNTFNSYIKAVTIYELLERCTVGRNIYHFRGLVLDRGIVRSLKEGFVLKNKSFSSTSISIAPTEEFALSHSDIQNGVIVVFKDTKRKQAIYLDGISAMRGNEFEVLLNLGYDFRFVKKLGNLQNIDEPTVKCPIWLCELEENTEVELRKYSYKKDATEKLLSALQCESRLMQEYYISSVTEEEKIEVMLQNYNNQDTVIGISTNGDSDIFVVFVRMNNKVLEQRIDIREKGYAYLWGYVYYTLDTHKAHYNLEGTQLSVFSERFMFELTNLFINNGFVVMEQKINTADIDMDNFFNMTEKTEGKSCTSEFSLAVTGKSAVKIKVCISQQEDDINIKLTAEYNEKSFERLFSALIKDRFSLVEPAYLTVVKEFNLNCRRRLKHIFSLVAGYYKSELVFREENRGTFKASFSGRDFNVSVSGTEVLVERDGQCVEFNYFDSIYDSASLIQTIC